ncbi:MAG: hypothetical protein COA78_19550 [Blastopirellula sp.]|nr:MAG: hypothetical protein COA78_19550 [Blastopirellula sp.]
MNQAVATQGVSELRKHFYPAQYPPETGETPTLAIISAYECLCGIADYTYFLVQSLSKFADVTIYELDTEVFQQGGRSSREDAINQLAVMCDEIKQFDAVNIQFEPGTLGYNSRVAFKRYQQIVDAAPAVSVTFHTFLNHVKESRGFWKELSHLHLFRAFLGRSHSRSKKFITGKPVSYLKQAGNEKQASFIVHTQRESKRLARQYGVRKECVFDHPLSYLNNEMIADLKPSRMLKSLRLPKDTILLGVFGFISEYKGTDLAVEMIQELPSNYHLLIAGSIHPAESRSLMANMHPYLRTIVDKILAASKQSNDKQDQNTELDKLVLLVDKLKQNRAGLEGQSPGSEEIKKTKKLKLKDRVHFLGSQDRDEFLAIMNECDAAILPYRDVGQTSSGPISMAVDLSKRIIASRTSAFCEFSKYHPIRLELFDQNNYLELSQRAMSPQGLEDQQATHNWSTNVKTYFSAHGFEPVTQEQWDKAESHGVAAHVKKIAA